MRSQNTQAFYVTQIHNNTKYTSDLEFRNYNYGYKTAQNSTLFGIDNWYIDMKPYNVFSQHIGAYLSWKNDYVRLNLGFFYENNKAKEEPVTINANQTALFKRGNLGNSLLLKATSETKITPNLTLEFKLEHRKNLSKAKLKQGTFGGKLEYKF